MLRKSEGKLLVSLDVPPPFSLIDLELTPMFLCWWRVNMYQEDSLFLLFVLVWQAVMFCL